MSSSAAACSRRTGRSVVCLDDDVYEPDNTVSPHGWFSTISLVGQAYSSWLILDTFSSTFSFVVNNSSLYNQEQKHIDAMHTLPLVTQKILCNVTNINRHTQQLVLAHWTVPDNKSWFYSMKYLQATCQNNGFILFMSMQTVRNNRK